MNLIEFNHSDCCDYFLCPERSVSPAVYILLYVCSAAVVLLTLCGNLIVIISVFHFKHLHTPTNMYLFSLAVSDFLVSIFAMPLMFIWTIESCWIFGRDFCIIYWLFGGLFIISTYTIAQISVDRYLALSSPFFYMNIVSVRITRVVIMFDWCAVIGYSIALLCFNANFQSSAICPGECFILLNQVWSVIDLVFSFLFPLSIIIILYTRIFVIAKKHVTAIRELNNHTRPKTQKITSHSMKSERKAAKVLCILVSVFLVCLFPYFVYSLLGNIVEISPEIIYKLMIIAYLNSTINSFIYALFYPWFRKCIKLIITLQIFQTDSALINVF